MKKIVKIILDPITLTVILFCGWAIWAGWGKKPVCGLDFLNALGPIAGGLSALFGIIMFGGTIIVIIWTLISYNDWYKRTFNK